MERNEVVETMRAKLADLLEIDGGDITEESRLVDDLDADSIDMLELVLSLKDRFGIEVNDGEVKELLQELARFLPDAELYKSSLSDGELAEVTRQLRVSTLVDFVFDRIGAGVS